MDTSFTTAEAAKLSNCAASSIRNYCRDPRFRPYLSAAATPGSHKSRQLSADDVRTLNFIARGTASGMTLDDVAASLAGGELQAFDWAPQDATAALQQPATTIEMVQVVQATAEALEARYGREIALHERITQLEAEAARLRSENDRLQAELAARKRSFWQRLRGG